MLRSAHLSRIRSCLDTMALSGNRNSYGIQVTFLNSRLKKNEYCHNLPKRYLERPDTAPKPVLPPLNLSFGTHLSAYLCSKLPHRDERFNGHRSSAPGECRSWCVGVSLATGHAFGSTACEFSTLCQLLEEIAVHAAEDWKKDSVSSSGPNLEHFIDHFMVSKELLPHHVRSVHLDKWNLWDMLHVSSFALSLFFCSPTNNTQVEQGGDICPVATFCAVGTATPQSCLAGTYNDLEGQDECFACPAGYYCPSGADSYDTTPCPPG